MDEKVTKPTIETVLERMAGMEERINHRMDGMEERMAGMEERTNQRLDGINERMSLMEAHLDSTLDRQESVLSSTRSAVFELRADFRDLTVKLKEHFPVLR